jgi:hypothetical protein
MTFFLEDSSCIAGTVKLKKFSYKEDRTDFKESAFKDLINGTFGYFSISANDLKRLLKGLVYLDIGVISLSVIGDNLLIEALDFNTDLKTKLRVGANCIRDGIVNKYSVGFLKGVLDSFKFKKDEIISLGFKEETSPLVLRIQGECIIIAPRVDVE